MGMTEVISQLVKITNALDQMYGDVESLKSDVSEIERIEKERPEGTLTDPLKVFVVDPVRLDKRDAISLSDLEFPQ